MARGGGSDYTDLTNKPSINDVTLEGNKSLSDLGIQSEIDSSHKLSADNISDGSTNKVVTASEKTTWSGKQDALVSGTNIKTINNTSILGSGNINISGGSGSVDYYEEAKALLSRLNNDKYNVPQATQGADEYDIILFSGQSNSCGRARTTDVATDMDVFLSIASSKAITFNNNSSGTPQQIVEPISANGTSYYGYIPAWLNAYYAVTGRKVCACYSSNGGTPIANFLKGATYYGASKVNNTKAALQSNNKTIGHIYLVWCQGETDGDNNRTTEYYKTNFRQMLNDLKADCGIEKAFMMRIGQINSGTSEKYRPIIKAQNELCQENDDIIMVSTVFAGALNFQEEDGSTRNLMRDSFHYKPEGYVRAGLEGGSNAGYYVNSGEKPTLLEYERLRINAAGWTDTKKYEREIDKYLFTQYIPYGVQRLLDDGGSTPPTPPSPTGVTLNKATLVGQVGYSETLTATITPSGATGTIVWSTSNGSVATVSNGTVNLVSAGSATITATIQGTALSASCAVTVSSQPIAPTGIDVSPSSASVAEGKTIALSYTLTPAGATGTVTWTSSDDSVATVNSNGVVSGAAEGNVTITATVDGTQISDTCALTVTEPSEWDLLDLEFRTGETFDDYVTNGTLVAYNGGGESTADGFLLARNETGSGKQPEAYFATPIEIPENFTVEWKIKCSSAHNNTNAMGQYLLQGKAYGESSEHRPMLGITKDGGVQLRLGSTNAYDYNGSTRIYDVRTDNEVFHTYRYEIEGNTFEAYRDGILIDSGNLPARPSGTLTFGKINYREPSTGSSTIDAGDTIAYIKMKTGTDPSPTPEPSSIALSESALSGVVGGSETLTYTIYPAGATGTVTWSSSDSNVATVNDGVVNYVAAGSATITATIDGTAISDTCSVTITAPIAPTGIQLSDSAMVINQRESQQLTYTLLPAGATGTVSWSTNDSSIATVVNGLVTGVGVGMTTITATIDGTAIADTCEVSVQANPYLLNLDFTNGQLPSDYVTSGVLQRSDVSGTSETDGLRITNTTSSIGNGLVFASPIQMPTNFAVEIKFQTYDNDGSRFGIANAVTIISNGSNRPMVNLFDGYVQFRLLSSGGDQKITSLGQVYDYATDGLVTLRFECRDKELTVYKNGTLVGTTTLAERTADTFSSCTCIGAFPYWRAGDLISYLRIEAL